MGKLRASEFEGNGVYPFGGYGVQDAWEALRLIMRTEQDPDGDVNLNAPADKFEHGGIESVEHLTNSRV